MGIDTQMLYACSGNSEKDRLTCYYYFTERICVTNTACYSSGKRRREKEGEKSNLPPNSNHQSFSFSFPVSPTLSQSVPPLHIILAK